MIGDRILKNLKENNYKIEYIRSKPYKIFKIENFLSSEEYEYFKNGFQDLAKLPDITKDLIKNKFSYNSSQDLYKKNILENQSAKDLQQTIFNKEFVNFFYSKFFFDYFYSRIDDPLYIIKLLRPKIVTFEQKKYNIFEKFFLSKLTPQIEYSYMFNNGRIDPHTDFKGKLISLMLYFPDDNLEENFKANLGTTFYESNLKNKDNKHLDDLKKREEFYVNSKKILTLPFEKKTLYGFIRTKQSWHTVEEFELKENFVRKSININLFL